jgi:hypothetical protein
MDKDRPRIAISFSGGRTSAVMTKLLIEKYSATHELLVTFANTGQEHPATLGFVKQCDERLGFNTVWLEAVVDPEKGKGVRHKVVSYHTASRDGRPFRDYIAKYGIPNMGSPKCTGVLKEDVMKHYLSSVWGRGTYATAIGIRADEESRVSVRAVEARFIYPLVDLGYTKEKVIAEVRTWGFDLTIPEHYGNCTWCWKKSYRKLLTIAKEAPGFLDFPRKMEDEFGHFKVTPATASPDGRRLFFRKHKSVADIFEDAKKPFEPFTDKHHIEYDENLDFGVGCGESCEIGSDERYGVDVADEDDFNEKEFWG